MARRNLKPRLRYVPPDNDNISRTFELLGLIPKKHQGRDDFLDVTTWNLRWFHPRESERVERVAEILTALNSDLMIFEEIAEGSLEPIAAYLEKRGAGFYSTAYGTTGGQQRVGFMWDIEWIRAKDDVTELFGKGSVKTGNKDAFPRLPLWGYFTGLAQTGGDAAFDFQCVGVHLKSQVGGGSPQRKAAASALAKWFSNEGTQLDADILLLGDFNKVPSSPDWKAFHELEEKKKLYFCKINDESELSHIYYTNKSDIGSRLDLVILSTRAKLATAADPAVVKWTALDTFMEHQHSATDIKRYLNEIKQTVSDHLPVLTRFYFSNK